MKKMLLLFFILLCSLSVFAEAYITEDMKNDIMTVDKLSRGMKGYGLTVFQGVTIEKFNFTILGVIKQANRGKDLIYVELDHPRINKTNSSVIQGMSGSPCYIEGKLIGAVSMGWGFAKENVCMLTPIMDMFETWDPALNSITSNEATIANNNQIPLSVSGLSKSTEEILSPRLKQLGFVPVAGGGKGSCINMPDADKATIEPGSSVGCLLIDGDIMAAGTGTVTYKKGNKILAFGHPMNEIGAIDVPMCTAYITDIFSSYEVSHKICNPLNIVGKIYQDRSFAIAGELGKEAKMSPVTVKIKDHSTNREENLNCRVVSQPVFFNSLSAVPIIEGLSRCRVQKAPTYGEFTYTIELENGSKYEIKNSYTDENSIDLQVAVEVLNLLKKLNASKFGIQKVKSLSVTGDLYNGNKNAFIERVYIDKTSYEPGDTMKVGIVMRKYSAPDTFTITKNIKIPKNTKIGKIALVIQGGILGDINSDKKEDSKEDANLSTQIDDTISFDQYFKDALDNDHNNELVISLIEEKGTVMVARGEKLEDLPDYMKLIFSNKINSLISTKPVIRKNVWKEDFIPMGLATVVAPVTYKTNSTVYDNTIKPLCNVYKFGKNYKELSLVPKSDFVKLIDELDEALKVTAKDVKDKNIPSTLAPLNNEEKENKENKETEKKEEKKEEVKSNSKIKTSIKKPLKLVIKDANDFNKGEFVNCNFVNGEVLPTVHFAKKITGVSQFAVCGIKSDFGTIIGFGLDSAIGFIKKDKIEYIKKLDNLWVQTMCEANGYIFVATNPKGEIYRIDKNKNITKLVFNHHHKYISDMIEVNGNILIGFLDSNEMLLCDSNLKVIKTLKHKDLYTTKFVKYKKTIYVATDSKILAINKDYKESIYINDLGGVITTLTINSKGELYAYVYGKNIIVKKSKDTIEKIVPKSSDMFTSYTDNKDIVYFAGKDEVLKIYSDGKYVSEKYIKSACEFSSIIPVDENHIYITSTNPGSILKVNIHPKKCSYTSPILDFGENIYINSIKMPNDYKVKILKGKKELDIDKTKKLNNFKVLVKFNGNTTKEFKNISIDYFTENKEPNIKVTNINSDTTIKAKQKFEWTVKDPNNDNYEVAIFIKGEKENYKQIYPNDKEKAEPDKDPIKSYELNTEDYKDGIYSIKFVVDDTISNPEKGKTNMVELTNIKIKNQGPELNIKTDQIKIKENEPICVMGYSKDKDLLGVEYSIGEAYRQVKLIDGKFNINLKLPKGTYALKVRAVDTQENHTDKEIKIIVE